MVVWVPSIALLTPFLGEGSPTKIQKTGYPDSNLSIRTPSNADPLFINPSVLMAGGGVPGFSGES